MLNIKTKGLLLNIIKHCERIEEKIQECNKKSFDSSDDIKEISEHSYIDTQQRLIPLNE